MKVSEIPGASDMLGIFLMVNERERKRHTVSTWRCKARGHLLGHTLDLGGSEAYLSVVDDPHPHLRPIEAGAVSAEDLRLLTVEEFISEVEAGRITWEDVAALRTGRKWWVVSWPGDGDLHLSCTCRTAIVPVSAVAGSSRKKIIIDMKSH